MLAVELTPDNVTDLNELLTRLDMPALHIIPAETGIRPVINEPAPVTDMADVPVGKTEKPAAKRKADKPTAPVKVEEATAAPSVDKTAVRAAALVLSKAGMQPTLKEIFAKYGADKLSDIAEADYPALLADLEQANV
jgi:hypothetical protein